MYTREQMVALALKYKGASKGSARHKDLVNTFNKVKPNGEVANYKCAWCAITVTALAIKAGFTTKNFPMSYNCGTMITKAKALGIWKETDSYKPKIGDVIIYSWTDPKPSTELKKGASHTGIVVSVSGNNFDVLEGNKGTSSACGIRKMKVNGQYIRGFILPKYATAKLVTKPTTKYSGSIPTNVLKYGDNGSSVKSLQKFLNWYHKEWKLAVDGSFGAKTKSALMGFQMTEALEVDGIYGTKTKAKAKTYVSKSTAKATTISKAEKLARAGESISWAYGTPEKKWSYKTGSPTSLCKTWMKKRGYTSKVDMSDCGYFINTVIYKALGKKVKVLAGTKEKFPSVSGFTIVHKGAVTSKSLKRGDIIRYKSTSGQHVCMYLGNGLIDEAGRKIRNGVIRKSAKYNSSYVKKSTVQVLRVKE